MWVLPALCVAAGAYAGEKLKFTEPSKTTSDAASRPDRGTREGILGPLNFKGSEGPGGGDGMAFAPPPTGTSKLDPKVKELLEQKKNWIFSTPSKSDSDSTYQQLFNSRETRFEGMEKKPKSSIERYFEREAETRKEISAKYNSSERENSSSQNSSENTFGARRDKSRTREESSKLEESGSSTDLSSSSLIHKSSSKESAASPLNSDLIPRKPGGLGNEGELSTSSRHIFGGATENLTRQEQRFQEFQKMLPGQGRFGIAVDPINNQVDATRQALNPVLGRSPSSAETGLNTGLSDGGVSPLAGSGIRSGIVDAFGSRGSGGSSLSPGFTMPGAAPVFQPRPAVLEIPRRRF